MTKAEQALAVLKGKTLDQIFWEEWQPEFSDEHEFDLDERRWTMTVQTVYEFDDNSYVAILWGRGLTEYQDNDGPYEIYLVEPYQVTQTKFRKIHV